MAFTDDIGNHIGNFTDQYPMTEEQTNAHKAAADEPTGRKNLYDNKGKLLKAEAELLQLKLQIVTLRNSDSPDESELNKLQQKFDRQKNRLSIPKQSYDKQIQTLLTRYDEKQLNDFLAKKTAALASNDQNTANEQKTLENIEKNLAELAGASWEKAVNDAKNERMLVEAPVKKLKEDLEKADANLRNAQGKLDKVPEDAQLQKQVADLQAEKTRLEYELRADSEVQKKITELNNSPLYKTIDEWDQCKSRLQTLKNQRVNDRRELATHSARLKIAKEQTEPLSKEQEEATATYEAFETALNQDDPAKLQAALTEIQNRQKVADELKANATDDLDTLTATYNYPVIQVRKNIQKVIDAEVENQPKCLITVPELTEKIQKTVPNYHLDLSEEAQAKRTELHNKAKEALHASVRYMYNYDDPLVGAGLKVWTKGRECVDFGPYIALYMDQEAKDELLELGKMVDEGKNASKEFRDRRNALRVKICRHATSIAKETIEKFNAMSTEEQIEHYSEIYTFSRLGDVTNNLPNSGKELSPEEFHDYYEQLDPALSMGGEIGAKIQFLASDFGDKIDYEQLLGLTPEQQETILAAPEEKPIMTNPDSHSAPIRNLNWLTSQQFEHAVGQLALSEEFPEFRRPYLDHYSQSALYQDGFKNVCNYQTLDGRSLNENEAMAEIYQNKRPIMISTPNAPDADPVMMYIQKGKSFFGPEAAATFRAERNKPEFLKEPKPVERSYVKSPINSPLKAVYYVWNGLCNFLQKNFSFVNNLDSVRNQWMIDRNNEDKVFDEQEKAYKKDLAEYNKNRSLFEKEGTLDKREAEAKARREKTISDYAKSLNGDKTIDPDDQKFLDDLNKTNLDVSQKMDLLQLRALIQDDNTSIREEFNQAMINGRGAMDADTRKKFAADATQNQKIMLALLDEVKNLGENGNRRYHAERLGIPTGPDRPRSREGLKNRILATFEKNKQAERSDPALSVPSDAYHIQISLLGPGATNHTPVSGKVEEKPVVNDKEAAFAKISANLNKRQDAHVASNPLTKEQTAAKEKAKAEAEAKARAEAEAKAKAEAEAKAKAEAEAKAKAEAVAKKADLRKFAHMIADDFTLKNQYIKDLSNSPLSPDDQKNLYLMNRVIQKKVDELQASYKAATENGTKPLSQEQCHEFAAKAATYNLVGTGVFQNIENLVSGETTTVSENLTQNFQKVENPDTQKYAKYPSDISNRLANIDGNLQKSIQDVVNSNVMKNKNPTHEQVRQMIDAFSKEGTAADRDQLVSFTKTMEKVIQPPKRTEEKPTKKPVVKSAGAHI